MTLLSRQQFRESVFKRDNNKCVICFKDGQDAHHIIERRLFDNGGYYLDNGATLCGDCHILAEKTILTCEKIRSACGIRKVILPDHLYEDNTYDKWGNIINQNGTRLKGELFNDKSVQKILHEVIHLFTDYIKYPRTYHLPCSPGKTDDDKSFKDYSIFEGKNVVITTKMDGENTTGYYDGYIHARSIDSKKHESRSWVKNFLQNILYELPQGWRICGENLFAKHSIKYTDLKSYFYLFSIWDDNNNCLSWNETIEFAKLLNIETVPVIFSGQFNQSIVESLYETMTDQEGFVVRNSDKFNYIDFRKNVGKYVRENHVQTSQHWLKKKLEKNELSKSL